MRFHRIFAHFEGYTDLKFNATHTKCNRLEFPIKNQSQKTTNGSKWYRLKAIVAEENRSIPK